MSNRVMQKLDHIINRASNILIVFSGLLILLMGWDVTFGVVMRYAFDAPEPYTYELSAILLLFCGIFAVAAVERFDRHVRNDLISSRFPEGMRIILLNTVFPFMALLFVAVLTWKSIGNASYALKIGQISQSTWAVPLAPIKFVIPVGYVLLCIVLIAKFYQGLALMRARRNQTGTE